MLQIPELPVLNQHGLLGHRALNQLAHGLHGHLALNQLVLGHLGHPVLNQLVVGHLGHPVHNQLARGLHGHLVLNQLVLGHLGHQLIKQAHGQQVVALTQALVTLIHMFPIGLTTLSHQVGPETHQNLMTISHTSHQVPITTTKDHLVKPDLITILKLEAIMDLIIKLFNVKRDLTADGGGAKLLQHRLLNFQFMTLVNQTFVNVKTVLLYLMPLVKGTA
jgi:hypothetical protein